MRAQLMGRHNRIVALLVKQQVALGGTVPQQVAEDRARAIGRKAATDPQINFLLVDMRPARAYSPSIFRTLREAMLEGGLQTNPNTHPLIVRLPAFRESPAVARQHVAELLNFGAHGIAFSDVQSAGEAAQALEAMRYARAGAAADRARPAGVGEAAAFWGMPDEEYVMRADLYPQNPLGDLASFVLIESEAGVKNLRAIAEITPTVLVADPAALRVSMEAARVEAALQALRTACRDGQVPSGIITTDADVERRFADGYSVVIRTTP